MGLITATLMVAGTLLLPVVSKLLADEGKAWLPSLTERLLRHAVLKLSPELRERFAEEWSAHLNEVPGDISKLLCALSFRGTARRSWINYIRGAMTASLLLVLLWPHFLIFGIWIKLESPGPIFVTVKWCDSGGRRVRRLVFRTIAMNRNIADNVDHDLSNDDSKPLRRITRSGKFLRCTSMRELPTLLSVLLGNVEMNLIIDQEKARRLFRELFSRKST